MTAGALPSIDGYGTKTAEILDLARSYPLAKSNRGYEVLRYAEGHAVLNSPGYNKTAMFKDRIDAIGITDGQVREDWEILLPTTDGDLRTRLRTMFASMMRPRQVAKFQSTVDEIVTDVFDEIGDSTLIELMTSVAWKVPSRMYCNLVSAPYEFAPKAAELSDRVLGPIVARDVSRRDDSINALYETYDIVSENIERRRDSLSDDFTSAMIRSELDGKLSKREMVWNAVGLLHASIDNTVQQMGLVVATLLERRDVWEQLVADPELIPAAVEEAMRVMPRFNVIPRLTETEVELSGHRIPADTPVFVSIQAANRDPAVVENPDEFRLDRPTWRPLLFGGGNFNCLGQHLARLEIQIVVRELVRRYPSATLDGEWEYEEHAMGNEVHELNVRVG